MEDFSLNKKIPRFYPRNLAGEKKLGFSIFRKKNRACQSCFDIFFPLPSLFDFGKLTQFRNSKMFNPKNFEICTIFKFSNP